MKKILFISTMNGGPLGGSEVFWHQMALWMVQRGYLIHCCYFDWAENQSPKIKMLGENGCTLHKLPNHKLAKNYLERLLTKQLILKKLIHLVKKDFDLVCISQGGLLDVTYPPFNSMLTYLKKFVLLYHNYNEAAVLSSFRKRRFKHWAFAAEQNMIAAGRIEEVVKKIAGFDLPNTHVLKNPITIPVQETESPWPALNAEGAYVWVSIGQLEVNRKAQDILIQTLAADKWKRRNWQLFIYGEGPDRSMLSNLIKKLKLDDKIFLQGHSTNVENILLNAHLVVQISLLDAMPISITEAMNMARPCIVSKTGDMPVWIEDGKQGFVASAVTVDGINEVLEKAWNSQNNWQEMGKAAFTKFHEKYPSPYELYYEKYLSSIIKI